MAGRAVTRVCPKVQEERVLARRIGAGIDRRKLAVQVGAQAVDDGDDRERDTGRDQAVFNRGRTRMIGQDLVKATLHLCLRRVGSGLTA